MKKSTLLHVLWLVVATGAFFGGSAWQRSRTTTEPEPGPARPAVRTAGATPVERAGKLKAGAVSRDASITEFLTRYRLGEGGTLSPETMRLAMSEALRETNPVKNMMLFSRLLEEMTPENAEECFAVLKESVSGWELMRYMPLMAYQWGSVDARSAFAELDKSQDPRLSMIGKPIVLAGLAAQDPAAAQAWLNEQKDLPNREFYTQAIIGGLAQSDPEAAVRYAAAQESPDERARAAAAIAQRKIREGLDGAAEWVATLNDPDMKRGAAEAVTNQLATSDVSAAARYVQRFAHEEWAGGAIRNVAAMMAERDPREALEFAAAVSGPGQPGAYGEAIQRWTRRNPEEASAYVNEMPKGANRDAAAAVLAREVSGEDPGAAVVWAGSIDDAKQRRETLVEVGRNYFRTQPEAAAQWLNQSGLPEETRQQILQPRRGDGGFPWFRR